MEHDAGQLVEELVITELLRQCLERCQFRRSWPSYTYSNFPDRFPWLRQMDLSSANLAASKTFSLTERYRLNLRGEAFNITNSPYFGPPDTGYQNARFGMLPLEQRNFPRLVQISAKLLF